MILTNPYAANETPHFDIETLFRRHGALRVLAVAVATLLTGSHRRLPGVDALPDHLRRDIGLEAHRKKTGIGAIMR